MVIQNVSRHRNQAYAIGMLAQATARVSTPLNVSTLGFSISFWCRFNTSTIQRFKPLLSLPVLAAVVGERFPSLDANRIYAQVARSETKKDLTRRREFCTNC
jgi:hypothetical protein